MFGLHMGIGGMPQDDAEAVKQLCKAAGQGDAKAQNNLGALYVRGRGVPQDDTEAVKWFHKAAEQGDAHGQFNLGLMYHKGTGVPQDDTEAAKWWRKAAEQDHLLPNQNISLTPFNLSVLEARFNLGLMYREGRGVLQDDTEAAKWWRKAAEQGQAWAQHALGVMHAFGRGVSQDHDEAVMWWHKAAEQGHAGAQHNLGVAYDGAQDNVQAYAWFDVAATQGHTKSAELKDRVAERLTSEERARAQKMAGAYWKAYVLPFRP